jgi:hypothetical protein
MVSALVLMRAEVIVETRSVMLCTAISRHLLIKSSGPGRRYHSSARECARSDHIERYVLSINRAVCRCHVF